MAIKPSFNDNVANEPTEEKKKSVRPTYRRRWTMRTKLAEKAVRVLKLQASYTAASAALSAVLVLARDAAECAAPVHAALYRLRLLLLLIEAAAAPAAQSTLISSFQLDTAFSARDPLRASVPRTTWAPG